MFKLATVKGLSYERQNVWGKINDEEKEATLSFAQDYKNF